MAQETGEAQAPIKASWFLTAASGQKSSTLTWPWRQPRVNPCFYAKNTHMVGAKQHSAPGIGSLCEKPKWRDHLSDFWLYKMSIITVTSLLWVSRCFRESLCIISSSVSVSCFVFFFYISGLLVMKRILLVFILAAAVMYGILHGNLWRNNFYWYGDALFI